MTDTGRDLVTGAFGNTGAVIAARLLAEGRRVRTLTSATPADPRDIEVWPYTFDDPDVLTAAFDGVTTFYNTFWARLGEGGRYEPLVAKSRTLIDAAARAGVERIVHLSVLHADRRSPYAYFRAKAEVEDALRAAGTTAGIVRPALVFGGDAALIRQLAALLRKVPLFGVPGDGSFRVRPVHVDDVAALCLSAGRADGDSTVDAIGPERPTFRELVIAVRDAVGSRARIVGMPAPLVLAGAKAIGLVTREPLLTKDELCSTMDGIADADGPATGDVRLSEWLRQHGSELGR